MTISSTANLVVYEGNGASTTFDYTFLIPTQDDAVITYIDTAGTETVLVPAQYSISGIGDANGGTVTFTWLGSPIANNTFLSIRRELPLTQTTDLVNQDGFYPQVVEDALDTLCMQIQQVSTLDSQAIRVPESEAAPDALPAAALRANQSLVFDSNGQPTVGSPSNATVSSVMQPVVAASTLADARGLFGVGGVVTAIVADEAPALTSISTNYMVTAAVNFTLLATSQLPNGWNITIHALTNDVTVTPDAADTIYGYTIGTAATVAAGTVATIVTDGAGNWWITTVISSEDFVGSMRPYAGFSEPSAKYVFCDGASYLRATYPACFTAVSMAVSGTRNSGSPTISGFTSAQTAKLAAGMLVEGTGIPSGATILTTPSGGDTSITLNQNATSSGTDTVTIIPHGAADSSHFNVPDTRGRVLAGAELATNAESRLTSTYFGAADRLGRPGGLESHTLVTAELPTVTPTGTNTKPTISGQNSGVATFDSPTGPFATPAAGNAIGPVTGSTLTLSAAPVFTGDPFGLNGPHKNVQPTLVVNHLIRVLP